MSHLAPQDVIPQLRNDLNATPPPSGTGAEVIRVGPIGSDERMAMHGFEFSIARMLDGKRTAEDVMLNCERLGLPIDLPSLESFLAQLQSHGLIARGGNPYEARPSGRNRQRWSDTTRSIYGDALRLARLGDVVAARRKIHELLWVDPHIPEAQRLRDWLEHPPSGDAEQFQRLVLDVERIWREGPPEDQMQWLRPRARRIFVGVLLVAVLVSLSFIPFTRMETASARVYPMSSTPIFAGRNGKIVSVAVVEGARVNAGAELFVVDPGNGKRSQAFNREANTVRAPVAGVVHDLNIVPEQWVTDDRTVLQLDDLDDLKLSAVVRPSLAKVIKPGERLTIWIDESPIHTTVDSVTDHGVIAAFPNTRQLSPGPMLVNLELAPASMWQRAVH
jgi:hypothetical protein